MLLIVFPHQLFDQHPGLLQDPSRVALIEDSLFFGDKNYPTKFHQQKLWLHRASMKRYESRLQQLGYETIYLEYDSRCPPLNERLRRLLIQEANKDRVIGVMNPVDFILKKRINAACETEGIECRFYPSPGFLNSSSQNQEYRSGRKRWFMADFYKWQRQRLNVLVQDDQPAGGQWSFDEDNRRKVPKRMVDSIPDIMRFERDEIDREAQSYVRSKFASNPGRLENLYYPTSREDALRWLEDFLKNRFQNFGDFEDAIVENETWLWHSVLTPALNIGLLTPREVVDATLSYASENDVPLNSLEGFVRQIIGWREFIRATYEDLGVKMRTTNHWEHHRPIPDCFYDGTTGIPPIDDVIQRILETGYCHHIERLMVLGGFMFLCEIDPDDIYQWFMEMFVDSYDWVMVPNVYAMSQHADGGLITTKPYFSGSSYVRKMSHHKKGSWCDVWDGLYWRWIWNHADQLAKNPRWAMMCSMARKMDPVKRNQHLDNAEQFLSQLP